MADSLSRRQAIGLGAAVAGAAVAAPVLAGNALAGTGGAAAVAKAGAGHDIPVSALPWQQAQDIVNGIAPTSFPSATFDVTTFGAKGNGSTDNTAAFAAAISACNKAGGGHVVVPAGTFVTGAIYLKSNVDLHLSAGATLKFSGD